MSNETNKTELLHKHLEATIEMLNKDPIMQGLASAEHGFKKDNRRPEINSALFTIYYTCTPKSGYDGAYVVYEWLNSNTLNLLTYTVPDDECAGVNFASHVASVLGSRNLIFVEKIVVNPLVEIQEKLAMERRDTEIAAEYRPEIKKAVSTGLAGVHATPGLELVGRGAGIGGTW